MRLEEEIKNYLIELEHHLTYLDIDQPLQMTDYVLTKTWINALEWVLNNREQEEENPDIVGIYRKPGMRRKVGQ